MAAVGQERLAWASRPIAAPGSVTALRYATAASPGGVMLESVALDARSGRHSMFALHPAKIATVPTTSGIDPFEQLAAMCRPWRRLEPEPELPFVGGWIGYLAYEAGRFVEPSAGWRHRGVLPVCQWGLYDTAIIHDRVAGRWHVAGVALPPGLAVTERPGLAERLDALEQWVNVETSKGRAGNNQRSVPARQDQQSAFGGPWTENGGSSQGWWNFSREEYIAKVRRALEYIRAGDIFQVNLTRRCRCAVTEKPIALYDRLCATNPAAYAAYLPVIPDAPSVIPWSSPLPFGSRLNGVLSSRRLNGVRSPWNAAETRPQNTKKSRRQNPVFRPDCPDAAILSSSPELFLSVRGREVATRPIKGTRPRGLTPDLDDAAVRELAASEKDRAELNMIIDLERNDLGRVCEYGSVRVVHDGEIEMLPTVIHRTATVVGRLREVREGILAPAVHAPADALDLLRATFPGGSITGAPKVRAMQIIDELEPEARGPYCGAIGYLGVNGDVQLSLAIRTMVAKRAVSYQLSDISRRLSVSARRDGRSEKSRGGAPEYEVSLHVGSGIVADSDPGAEYEELQAKAAGMVAALGRGEGKSCARSRLSEAVMRNK
jgi:para-aminobenzoate synthetase component 1